MREGTDIAADAHLPRRTCETVDDEWNEVVRITLRKQLDSGAIRVLPVPRTVGERVGQIISTRLRGIADEPDIRLAVRVDALVVSAPPENTGSIRSPVDSTRQRASRIPPAPGTQRIVERITPPKPVLRQNRRADEETDEKCPNQHE